MIRWPESSISARATGAVLLLFSAFILLLGLNQAEVFWLGASALLLCGATALLLARPWSGRVLLLTAVSAAVVGFVGQVHQALLSDVSVAGAGAVWLLWSALWLLTALIGGRALPPSAGRSA